MSNAIMLLSTTVAFLLGFGLPDVLPKKQTFIEAALPSHVQDCQLSGGRCYAEDVILTLEVGQFTPLRETLFHWKSSASWPEAGTLYVSSDDQRFGTIKAEPLGQNRYRVMIPYCSNQAMRIIVFPEQDRVGMRLPVLGNPS